MKVKIPKANKYQKKRRSILGKIEDLGTLNKFFYMPTHSLVQKKAEDSLISIRISTWPIQILTVMSTQCDCVNCKLGKLSHEIQITLIKCEDDTKL